MPRKRHPAYLDSETQEWSRKQRHALPPKISKNGMPARANARAKAKKEFARQIAKERAIGTDPQFHHGSYYDLGQVRSDWLKKSRAYDLTA